MTAEQIYGKYLGDKAPHYEPQIRLAIQEALDSKPERKAPDNLEGYLEGKKHYAWEMKSHVSVVDTVTALAALQQLSDDKDAEIFKEQLRSSEEWAELKAENEKLKKDVEWGMSDRLREMTKEMAKATKLIQDLAAENERLKGWISVEERLPECDEMVITYPYSMVTIRNMKMDGKDKVWFFDAIPVTHWKPLPEPPKH